MTTWTPGLSLGPYVLISQIGSGGMSEVWKARDTRLDRIVAVKRLSIEHNKRFEQEARAIAALNHPHICQLYDVGPDYLVMEFIEGQPLRGPLSEEEALRLALQIVSALEEAHRRSIIHRDLKPANVMVTNTGAAKLLDFGIAKHAANPDFALTATVEGTVIGTAAYMSPEQAEGKTVDARSDIFSFGAVLYEMLSGGRAFSGSSTVDILSAVLRDQPPPLRTQPAFEAIVKQCLAKAPSQRFQTMTELRSALEKVPAESARRDPSIAVLPFANMSGDKENEYFSDGLAEEIINVLAHIPGLKVTARTSAFAFRGKEQDIRRIAEALGVRTILEGSVRRAGNRIRVTAQLINAEDGYHLWSERYDREMSDVFALQDEIAQAISVALQAKLTVAPATPRRYQPKLPAYEAYLKARHHLMRPSPDWQERVTESYKLAIALDPQFALPHYAVAEFFIFLAVTGLLPAREAMPMARAEAQKALDIDSSLGEAHAMLAVVAASYEYDWAEAERRFGLAMTQGAVSPQVRIPYAMQYLVPSARFDEAAREIRQALQEDPLNIIGRVLLGSCLYIAGKFAEAEVEIRAAVELDPNLPPALGVLGNIHFVREHFAEARSCFEKGYALSPQVPIAIGSLAGVLARTGDTKRAEELLEKLGDPQAYGAAVGYTMFHFFAGENDKIADWYEKMIEQRYPQAPGYLRGPIGMAFRSSPRWDSLARMMNLPGLR
jgi:eukaryotic-like serine/threonine-protein kinase